MGHEPRPVEGPGRVPAGVEGGQVDEHRAQEGEGDPDRADDDVLPRRLERALGPAVADEERGRHGRRLDADPEHAEVGRQDGQQHGGDEHLDQDGIEGGAALAAAAVLAGRPRWCGPRPTRRAAAMAPMTRTMKALRASARSTPPDARQPARAGRRRPTTRSRPRPGWRWYPRPPRPPRAAIGRRPARRRRRAGRTRTRTSIISRAAPGARRGRCRRTWRMRWAQHLQDHDAEQHVEGHAQLDEEGDAGGHQERHERDAVVHQQQPDDLEDRTAPRHEDEEPDEQRGEADGDERPGRATDDTRHRVWSRRRRARSGRPRRPATPGR